MNLYVIRHGQTDANEKGLAYSREEVGLNETGIEQAKVASKIIENLDYDLVISSPLERAKQTAKIVNEKKNKEILYDDRLQERDTGIYTGKNSSDKVFKDYWKLDSYYEGAENIDDLFARVDDFLDEILVKYSNKNILLVTHNGVCRAIKAYFEGYPKSLDVTNFGQDNCEIKMYKI